MKNFFENNIFRNPDGWAKTGVGTSLRYRTMQICTIIYGILLILMFIEVSRPLHWIHYLGISIVIAVIVVEFPLCYLRALRHLYLKNKEKEKQSTNHRT